MAGQAYRRVASREERELQDVERAMEEELVAEHMQVERVIHLRLEQADGQQQLKYLVKVCVCPCSPDRKRVRLLSSSLQQLKFPVQGVCICLLAKHIALVSVVQLTAAVLSCQGVDPCLFVA